MQGPFALSVTGPVTLVPGEAKGDPPLPLFNAAGSPLLASIVTKKPAEGDAEPPRGSTPACVVDGSDAFCMAHSGDIRRMPLAGGDIQVVASARAATTFGAMIVEGGKALVVYLADIVTDEGPRLAAYAKLDDQSPAMLSAEGAGATFLSFARTGPDRALAMYIDERRAMAPVHAKSVGVVGGELAFGADAVVFVGGGSFGRMMGALSLSPGAPDLALVASERDMGSFGMAAIRVDDPPVEDAAVRWSLYPSALAVAPIAATQGTSARMALRLRPTSTDGGAEATLELGGLDDGGVFSACADISHGVTIADTAIVADGDSAVWLAYARGGKTYLERRKTR